MDTDDVVNHCSGAYAGGMVTGMVFQMVLAPEASEAEAAELESEAELLEEAESVGCFVAGTKVLTKEGEKPIDQLKKGDKVWSRDPDNGQFGWKTVTDTIVHYNKRVLRLELVDAQGHPEVLGVTGNHPFWVHNRGWTKAEDLLDGDEIFSSRGGWVKVGSASWFAHSQTVYNLEVDGFHTYFVGASGAWVHNGGCVDPYELEPTHGRTYSNREWRDFLKEVDSDGEIKQAIKYVEHDGTKYVVDGHHRLAAAKVLGFESVPAQEVELPFRGYNTVEDLFWW